ncbi:hypothetical protein B0O99DRAFT_688829 [Bisporella sp. PMI_857]|nr:hypothetical protein B0O99DRAFT_688829 [Bisporella sp. PMI_857]
MEGGIDIKTKSETSISERVDDTNNGTEMEMQQGEENNETAKNDPTKRELEEMNSAIKFGTFVPSNNPVPTPVVGTDYLTRLPDELIFKIFKTLVEDDFEFWGRGTHQVYSACLGLTCKKLYYIHKEKDGKVPLYFMAYDHARSYMWPKSLKFFLRDWMGDKYWYCECRDSLYLLEDMDCASCLKWHFGFEYDAHYSVPLAIRETLDLALRRPKMTEASRGHWEYDGED